MAFTTAYWTAAAIFTAGALLTALLYRPGRPDPADLATVPARQPRPQPPLAPISAPPGGPAPPAITKEFS